MSIGDWGKVLSWIFDRLPTKRESLLNRIKKIKREMDEITKKDNKTSADIDKYKLLGDKLRQAQDSLETIKT